MVVAIIGALISLGILVPNIVTAGKGVSFRSLHLDSVGAYERSLNEAVTVISSLNLSHEAIVNLDLANPFPVLFLATPPRGIQVWWHFGVNVPEGARLEWQDVVGDACVVTIPGKPYFEDTTARLADVVRPKLASDFHLVYQDASWSIYRRTRDCASAPR